jgi:hypothetical protein
VAMIKIGQPHGRSRRATATAVAAVCGLLAGFAPAGPAGASVMSAPAPHGSQVSTPGWRLQYPPNPSGLPDAYLSGVSCRARTACLAVGSAHSPTTLDAGIAESQNGSTWMLQDLPSGLRSSNLDAVSCPSATHCVAVGTELLPADPVTYAALVEVWSGSAWTVHNPAEPARTKQATLTGISCVSATRCMAVGWFARDASRRIPFSERLAGSTWTFQTAPAPSGATVSQLNAVSCASATSCVAVGTETYPANAMVAEGWNGRTWTLQSTPGPSGSGGSSTIDLQAVSCTATTACIATGFYYSGGTGFTLADSWNGTSWTLQNTPNPAGADDSNLGGVSCPSAGMCIAVGSASNPRKTSDLAEIWDGSAWSLDSPRSPAGYVISSLNSVWCPSTVYCMAAGDWSSSPSGNFVPLAARYS